ncbi:hypothetical protein [Candidatus Halobonum tyrrellensis]|uniref:STAS/SEC14 domain-containing protein n=1 Tax=Candidatus Halobonum tyrrellensis G22 TaxID=1324957 RepID=V4HG72_9EURY|nr:hypothetical protein [Candidatus Halobonum tyrrellensis]ESP89118.1 hypothetical protein K933_05428 [Candidatus Halobonum tyrrellensis G22]
MDRDIVSFSEEGDVLIIDLDGWDGDPEQIQGAEQEFLDMVATAEYRGVVTDLGEVSLGKETQEHIKRGWTELIEEAGLDRFAYVSVGLGAMATNANIQTDSSVTRKAFNDRTEAVEWVRSS